MNKKMFIFVAAGAVLLLAGAGCNRAGQPPQGLTGSDINKIQKPEAGAPAAENASQAAEPTASSETPAVAGQAAAQTANVVIQDFAFSPSSLVIKQGDTVVWSNDDSVSHQIASDPGTGFDFLSSVLYTGQSFNMTFTKNGTFDYHCQLHPEMTGSITVE